MGRVGLGLLDQGLSSISNVLFLVAVARESGLEEFGALSFAYALFSFGLAVQRNSIGTLISLSADRKASPPVLGSLLWAVTILTVGLVLGHAVGDGGSAAYYIVVAGSVVIYPQDLLRYTTIAERRAGLAVVSDASWTAVTLTLLVASLAGATLSVTAMTAVWVVLGAGAALVTIVVPLRARLDLGGQWFRDHATELRTLGPDALLACVAPLLLALVIARNMSLGDVAAVRGASTLLGPAAVLFAALPVVMLPEMARVLGDDRSRLARAQAVVMSLAVLAWGGCLALLPDVAGEQVLGRTWAGSRAILFLATLELVMWALASGPIALLGTYRKWRALLVVRVAYLGTVACALGLTVSGGDLTHVMVGMVVASAVNCVILTVAARWVHLQVPPP